jgi:hypothetical protein
MRGIQNIQRSVECGDAMPVFLIRRRVRLVALASLSAPRAARAQPAVKTARV